MQDPIIQSIEKNSKFKLSIELINSYYLSFLSIGLLFVILRNDITPDLKQALFFILMVLIAATLRLFISAASKENNIGKNNQYPQTKEWVRAAANLEAETGLDILIGADLGNNLDFSDKVIPSQIDVEQLTVVIQEGLKDLLSQEELTTLVAETNTYIGERVYHLKFDRSKV